MSEGPPSHDPERRRRAERAARIDDLFIPDRSDMAVEALDRVVLLSRPPIDRFIEIVRRALHDGPHPGPGLGDLLKAFRDEAEGLEARERAAAQRLADASSSLLGLHDLKDEGHALAAARERAKAAHRAEVVAPDSFDPPPFDSLFEHLEFAGQHLIRACTPSVLLEQRVAGDILQTDVSVSYSAVGSPIAGTKMFEKINQAVADYYGVKHAWSMVNGSTGCNWVIARWLRYRLTDEVVLIARGSHVSVPQSSIDFGLNWRYIDGDVADEYEALLPATPERVRAAAVGALEDGERIGAVWLNGPSYEGATLDVAGIRQTLVDLGLEVPLIVDEAWGSHFPKMSPVGIVSAIARGADLVNSSTHKQAGGLQGTAVIALANTGRIRPAEIDAAVASMMSTSPSFHLLSSIQGTYEFLNAHPDPFGRLSEKADRLRRHLRAADPEIEFFPEGAEGLGSLLVDPLKVVVRTNRYPATGYGLEGALAKHRVIVEMATRESITFLITHQLRDADVDAIVAWLLACIDAAEPEPEAQVQTASTDDADDDEVVVRALPPTEAAHRGMREGEFVPADVAPGRIAGERIAIYPPGIPVIVEGDQITKGQIRAIQGAVRLGAHTARSSGRRDRPGDDGEDLHILVLPEES